MTARAATSLQVLGDGVFSCAPFVDLAAHIRFPATPDVETPGLLAAAARAGGFGAVLVAPLGEGQCAVDGTVEGAQALLRHLDERSLGGFSAGSLVGVPSPVRAGDLAEIASLARLQPRPIALRLTHATADTSLLRRCFEMARAQGLLVIVPSVDASLAAGAVAVEGAVATRLGLPALPEAAEAIGVQRIIELARLTRARVHVAHVFSAAGVRAIRDAKAAQLPVTACASIVHLAKHDGALRDHPYDVRLRVWPPLPSEAGQAALRDGVRDGVLCISSGHAPAPKRERDLEMALASPGAATLEHVAGVAAALFTDAELVRALADQPAQITRLVPAGRVRCDMKTSATVQHDGALDGMARRGTFSIEATAPDGGAR